MNILHRGSIGLVLCLVMITGVYAQNKGSSDTQLAVSDYVGVSVEVPVKTQELMGIKLVEIGASKAFESFNVSGRIAQEAEKVFEVYAPSKGVIEERMVTVGAVVNKGQVLGRIRGSVDHRLEDILAPGAGVIMADLSEGAMQVDPASPIYMIADLSVLLAHFDVYERDFAKLKVGQKVEVYTTAYPQQVFEGQVVFISPRVDEHSLTLKVRIELKNPGYALKLGMFVQARISSQDEQEHLSVPSQAVVDLDGTMVVFLKDEEGAFVPTAVEVKRLGGPDVLIEGDLKKGDQVVGPGAFVLKSKLMQGEITSGCIHGN